MVSLIIVFLALKRNAEESLLRIVDEIANSPTQFVVEAASTRKELLEREDTDNNGQITIDDTGPKVSNMIV